MMRPARQSLHLLVLFLQILGLVAALSDGVNPRTRHQLQRRDAQAEDTLSRSRQKRPETGTKDAPVDGLDGKPHAGPFVEPLTASKEPASGSAKTAKDAKLAAEDGVMNDPYRVPPKKGTTGTEGGVSEKSKDREAQESEIGRKPLQKPTSPQEPSSKDEASRENQKTSDKNTVVDTNRPKDKDKSTATGSGKKPDLLYGQSGDHADSTLSYPKAKLPGEVEKASQPYPKSDEDSDDDDDDFFDYEGGEHDFVRWDSLAGSFSSIAATEIGDKTFIVAALMAMRHPRMQVFTAAFSALFIMTILSGITGHAVGALISKKWAAVVAALLFLVFGAKSLKEGLEMNPHQGVHEEIREVEAELEEKEVSMAHANGHRRVSSLSPDVLEAGRMSRSRSRSRLAAMKRSPSTSRTPSPASTGATVAGAVGGIKNLLTLVLSPAWVETFGMTFVGELGDRSQIATVAMAAGQEYFWIMVGASLGHFVCTAGAVLGGSVLAGRVSMRKVTLMGGAIFIGFGLFTLLEAIQYFR